MATIEALWQAATDKDYVKILEIVESKPEFINEVHPRTKNSLFMQLMGPGGSQPPEKLKKIILLIANDSNFNISYSIPKLAMLNNFSSIAASGSLYVIEALKNDSRIVKVGDQLFYSIIKNQIASETKRYETNKLNNPKSEELPQQKTKIENLNKMLLLVRDKTINYAIEKDDADLMRKLEAAGDDTSARLLDGSAPARRLEKRHDNLDKYFKEKLLKMNKSEPLKSTKILTECKQIHFKVEEKKKEQSTLIKTNLETTKSRLAQAASIMGKK